MLYVDTHSEDACFNFGVEYYFASEKRLPDSVFMLWRTSPTLMIGKYQSTAAEIDRAYAEEHGIEVVRRMSGGGTIFTDLGGWQFTFIDRTGREQIDFSEYIRPILHALSALGIEAEWSGRNDLLIGGRKFSGNAQYRLGDTTVHHGSLLFDTDVETMVRSTTVDPTKLITKSIASVRQRVTNISEHLKTPLTPLEFRDRLAAQILGEGGEAYELTGEDIARANALADRFFRPWETRYGADPKYSIVRSARTPGGKLEFRLDVKKGVITAASLTGDFFASRPAEEICSVLVGLPLRRDILLPALETGLSDVIYKVTPEMIAEILLQ